MHPLELHARPLLEREDIEGLTCLLETWQPRDEFWLQCVDSRSRAPSSTPDQKRRMRTLYLSAAPDLPPPPSLKALAKAFDDADARAAQAADALERALAADELCLPELAAAFGLAQDPLRQDSCRPDRIHPRGQRTRSWHDTEKRSRTAR